MHWTFCLRLCIVAKVARGHDGASKTTGRKKMERELNLRYLASAAWWIESSMFQCVVSEWPVRLNRGERGFGRFSFERDSWSVSESNG